MPTARARLARRAHRRRSPRPCSGRSACSSRFAYAEGMEPFAFVAWRAGVGAVGLWLVVAAIRGPRRIRRDLRAHGPARRLRWLGARRSCSAPALNLAAFLSFDHTTVALALLGFYTYPAMVAAGSVPARPGAARRRAGRRARCSRWRAWPPSSSAGRRSSPPQPAPCSAIAPRARGGGVPDRVRAHQPRLRERPGGARDGRDPRRQRVAGRRDHGGDARARAPSRCRSASPSLIALLVFVGLFAAALPSVLFLTGIRWIGGVRTGILMLFEPVVGVALAAALLAERPRAGPGARRRDDPACRPDRPARHGRPTG